MAVDVFEEYPLKAITEFSGNSCNVRPEVAWIVLAKPVSRKAEWLARVSGKQGVDSSSERPGIKRGEVVPNWRGGKVSGTLGCDNCGSGVSLPLDKCAGVKAGFCKHEAHIKATGSGAEGQSVGGT